MRRSQRVWILFSMLFGLEGMLAGQVILERALITGGSAAATTPARGVKKSVSGVMGSLDRVMKTGQGAADSGSPGGARAAEAAQPGEVEAVSEEAPAPVTMGPAKIYEDPLGIRAGMANEELVRRFGPPSLEVIGASNGRLLTYSGKNGIIQLELRNEKVTLVSAMNPQQAAVVLPAGQSLRIQ